MMPICAWAAVAGLLAAAPPEANPYFARWRAATDRLERAHGGPQAVAPLADLVGLRDEIGDEPLARALRAVADNPRAHPLAAAHAGFELARLDEDRGDDASAQRRRRALGLIEDFWVLGPFDAQGRAGIDTAFAPEQAVVDPRDGRVFDGKGHPVAWRRAEGFARDGALVLDALLRPDSQAAAYALVYLRSDRRRRAALRLGSAGPIKVWVNGRVVHARDVLRPPHLDQDGVAIDLDRGENVLCIKTVITDGPWRLLARVTEPDGRAARGVEASLDGTRTGLLQSDPGKAPDPVRPPRIARLAEILKARVAGAMRVSRRDAELDRIRYLDWVAPDDREEKTAETELRSLSGPGYEGLRLLGRIARDDNDRRAALRDALAQAPDAAERCLVLWDLGRLARAADREAEALARWREAIAALPDCWPAELSLAAEERDGGLEDLALARLDRLAARFPLMPIERDRARALDRAGRPAAIPLAEDLLRRRRTDTEALMMLSTAARDRGDLATSARHLERALRLRPELSFWASELSRTQSGLGRDDQAAQVLRDALVRSPDAPHLHESMARLAIRRGDRAAAIAELSTVLTLQPQSPAIRRQLERLRADAGGRREADAGPDLARAYAVDGEEIARPMLSEGAHAGPDPAEILLERRVVRVHPNGLSEVFVQKLVFVRTSRGARANQEFLVRYTPGDQEVEIHTARVYRRAATGEIEISEAAGRDDRDLSEPWYGMYFDNRADVVTFENLRAGDVLELQYTVADVSPQNHMADYFGDLQFAADTVPMKRWDYIVIAPRRRPLYFHTPALPGFSHAIEETPDTVIHTFGARDIPKINAEASMPGWAEVTPYLHVSTYRTWDEVGKWYWELVTESLTPDETVRAAALQAGKGASSVLEKVRAVHSFVIKGTRYVGLEFGIHGFKPYRVSQVLARRFGDCKDKASLMVVMLKQLGVEARLVLLRTRRGGRIDPMPASLAVFDHAIAYVPELDLYLDGTAEFSGMAELPNQDQGTMGLRVGPDGAELIETPILPSSGNRAVRTWTAVLDPDGGARVDETVTVVGQAAPQWRQHYQTPGERRERYDKIWSDRFPGAKVTVVTVNGTEDPNDPVAVTASVVVPHLGVIEDDRMVLPVSARPAEFLRSYARLSRRRQPLVLAFPWRHEETLSFAVPDGWRIGRLPESRAETTPFGVFGMTLTPAADGRTITIATTLDVSRSRFSPEEYLDFRRLLGKVDLALGETFALERIRP